MSLNEYEKYQIYQEEMNKKKMEEEAEREKKLKTLTPEEREAIYQQFNSSNVVLVDRDNFKEPDEKREKKYSWISAGVFLILFLFVHMILAVVFLVSYFIVSFYLGMRHVRILTPTIFYDCPHCGNRHSNVIRTEEKAEAIRTGFVNAVCFRCKENFKLLIKPEILDKFE